MDIFQSLIVARLIVILGITNLVSGLLVLFSCRCIPGLKITGKLMQHKGYQRFYKYHCYYWWIFWTSVMIHAALAIAYYGIP